MANNQQTLKQLFAANYFWRCSTTTSVFRPSEIFAQILQGYVNKLQHSHSRNKSHDWEASLLDNIIIMNNDTSDIRFLERPVRVGAEDDFDGLRERDYANLANLIESIHAGFFLPPISWDNSPELQNFLQLLRNPLGSQELIHKHYCLWGFTRRVHFMLDLRPRQDYQPFRNMTSAQFEIIRPFDFATEYPNGFWRCFDNDPFMTSIMDRNLVRGRYGPTNRPNANTFADFIKFICDMFNSYSFNNGGNPYRLSDLEWRMYEEFPFYLHVMCQILLDLHLFYAYI